MKAPLSTSILNSNPQSYFSSSVAVGNVARGYGAVARPRARDYKQTCESYPLHSYVRALIQHVEYLPFGEPLIEQRATSAGWQTDRLFNSKEYDAETGFYYYGARYYDPRLAIWLSPDPLQEKYPEVSSYCYVANNPTAAIDIQGKRILFVNGHWSNVYGEFMDSSSKGKTYWSNGFEESAKDYFYDYHDIPEGCYIDGSSRIGFDMSGKDRYDAGYSYARDNIKMLTNGLAEGEVFNIVTHSEGSAYGAGIAQYLLDAGYVVEQILHLSADEGDEFSTPRRPYTVQLSYQGDWVTGNKPIHNVDIVGEICDEDLGWLYVHGTTKDSSIFKAAADLRTVKLQSGIGMLKGKAKTWFYQIPGSTLNNTNFYKINRIIIRNFDGSKKN